MTPAPAAGAAPPANGASDSVVGWGIDPDSWTWVQGSHDVVRGGPEDGAVAALVQLVDQLRHRPAGTAELKQHQPKLIQRGPGIHTGVAAERPA